MENHRKQPHANTQITTVFALLLVAEFILVIFIIGFVNEAVSPMFDTLKPPYGKIYSITVLIGIMLMCPWPAYLGIKKPFWNYEEPPIEVKDFVWRSLIIGAVITLLGVLFGLLTGIH